MGILRHHHQANFTIIPNALVRDQALSCRDIGLLCKLLSLPDGWSFSVRGVCALCPHEGRDAITKSLRELESARYLRREGQSRRVRGTFAGADWIISDVPLPPMSEKPMTDLPSSVNPPQ